MTQVLDNSDLVYWNYPEKTDQPRISRVRDEVAAHGLWTEDLPDITPDKAFRRASVLMRDKTTDTEVFSFKDALHVQLDRVLVDEHDPKLNRTLSGVWKHKLTGPEQTNGYDYALTEELRISYEHALTTFSWADLGTFLKTTFDKRGLGLHALRDGGCVYTAPISDGCRELLDKVDAFCQAFGISFLRWQTPNTEAHKDEIRRAIARTMRLEIDEHEEAIAAYSEHTRPETFAGRRNLMSVTGQRLVRLHAHLNGQLAGFGERLTELEDKIKTLEADQAAHVPSGRRVLVAK